MRLNVPECYHRDHCFFSCTQPCLNNNVGQTFCCVAALSITGGLGAVEVPLLYAWLQTRQQPDGGVNGRPEKVGSVGGGQCLLLRYMMLNNAEQCCRNPTAATAGGWAPRLRFCRSRTCSTLRRSAVSLSASSGRRAGWVPTLTAHRCVYIGMVSARKWPGITRKDNRSPFLFSSLLTCRHHLRQDLFHTHFGLAALGVLGSPIVEPVHPVFCLPVSSVEALKLPLL